MASRRLGSDYISQSFLGGIAKALWILPWADYEEEHGRHYSGQRLDDVAPNPPPSAFALAKKFAATLEHLNKKSLQQIWKEASKADGREADPEDLGFYLTMPAMGHGVSWTDDHERFYVLLPYVDSHVFKSGRTWRVDGEVSERLARPLA